MLLKIKDLCTELRLTRPTIHKLRRQGLPFIKLGATVFFDPADVQEFINKKREVKNG